MAEGREALEIYWYSPLRRGIIPLDSFHISRSLRKIINRGGFEIKFDTAFRDVIANCAVSHPNDGVWISRKLEAAYVELHDLGFAHSVEYWRDGKLMGGLYGVSLGRAFFGESMFSYFPNASKIALVYLVERLLEHNFLLLDCQYMNEHLRQFGTIEIPKAEYLQRLKAAVGRV